MSAETDEFAAMLRELKERSGRSYGALATRLHLSTSTLHRYCNGAAVPTEYAPVERLGRACGASGEELVELHRRWLLADAARRRETAPEPAAEPAAPAPRAAAPDVLASDAAAPDEFEVRTVQTVRTERAEAPAPRRTRGRVLLSVAAVAVVAAVVSAFVLRDTGDDNGNKAAGRSTPPAATGTAPSAPAAVGGSTPSGGASAADETTANAPFDVAVISGEWASPCDQWFLSPRAPGQLAPPPTEFSTTRINSWAASQRLVPAGHLRIELTAQGKDASAVVLNRMSVLVTSTRPAEKWNAFTPGSGCGGTELTPAAFEVNLDAASPQAVPVPGKEGERKTAVTDFPYKISANDPQVIDVDAFSKSRDVSWYLEIEWSSANGGKGTKQVYLDGQQPFRTVGMQGAPQYFHNGTAWAPFTLE
ncbi:helix-turn-helix domain-containing protein [Kitasatospora sp. NPDC088134]|uniref:helix-turn-helix domain-containing protein n=1 Tax=Kitasatospora sp. NPDC088134 TaxID=3364071 RepID=UPI003830ED9A